MVTHIMPWIFKARAATLQNDRGMTDHIIMHMSGAADAIWMVHPLLQYGQVSMCEVFLNETLNANPKS
jgi:hypothetical protein